MSSLVNEAAAGRGPASRRAGVFVRRFALPRGLKLFEPAEKEYRQLLVANQYHPFHRVGQELQASFRSHNFIVGIVCVIILVCFIIGFYHDGAEDEFFYILLYLLLYATYVIYFYSSPRRLILDRKEKIYKFYRGPANTLVYWGHLHNVYIRLKGYKFADGNFYFKLVLNGFESEECSLTRWSRNLFRLRHLGKLSARALHLNYFDYLDVSEYHQVLHTCPYYTDH